MGWKERHHPGICWKRWPWFWYMISLLEHAYWLYTWFIMICNWVMKVRLVTYFQISKWHYWASYLSGELPSQPREPPDQGDQPIGPPPPVSQQLRSISVHDIWDSFKEGLWMSLVDCNRSLLTLCFTLVDTRIPTKIYPRHPNTFWEGT